MSQWERMMGCESSSNRRASGDETDIPVRRVDGKRYFQTPPLRASFVRPDKVTVGDFPELDPFADDEDMEM